MDTKEIAIKELSKILDKIKNEEIIVYTVIGKNNPDKRVLSEFIIQYK